MMCVRTRQDDPKCGESLTWLTDLCDLKKAFQCTWFGANERQADVLGEPWPRSWNDGVAREGCLALGFDDDDLSGNFAPLENPDARVRCMDVRAVLAVHAAKTPALDVGMWFRADVRPDWLTSNFSPAHLACLDTERLGNCHDDGAILQTVDKAMLSRHRMLERGHSKILDGPDVLRGQSDWAWRLNRSLKGDPTLRKLYQPLAMLQAMLRAAVAAFVEGITSSPLSVAVAARFVIVGDSVSRQFAKTLECSLRHKLGVTSPPVVYIELDTENDTKSPGFAHTLAALELTATDVLVVNVGLHINPSNSEARRSGRPPNWRVETEAAWRNIFVPLAAVNSPDPNRVFVRTTTNRFILRDACGDWDGGSIVCGALEPDMTANWTAFGGLYPSQPLQNQILLASLDETRFQLLDVAPLTLARADATFDCLHRCLPGDMDTWVSLLFARLFQQSA